MRNYFDTIMGYASYAFNKSHSYAYTVITVLMAWLKNLLSVQFYSAFLSMQAVEDLLRYIPMIRKEGIDVKVPEINSSDIDFTPNGNLYYLGWVLLKA